MSVDVDAETIRQAARTLYAGEPGFGGWLSRNRPAICPFERLVAQVPTGASVLDIGCGGGLFLGLLAETGRLRLGVGIDPDARAIERARRMSRRRAYEALLRFDTVSPDAALPTGQFDVVAMIDVMHHVAPAAQSAALEAALARVAPGGRFVYKDMARRPIAAAMANRLHDLLLARQWIHYVPIERVANAATAGGLRPRARAAARRFVYVHEWLIAERPAT